MKETEHLLSNSASAAWLARGIAQAECGQVQAHDLIDADGDADPMTTR
ncbi:hypothetical protein [Nocardia mexicana]|uniref:Uncharacterized protein n=1 Tax=Nocardia mexicana TaxID=279262 RepID=A0A370GXT0_9NOCA|nr:hypothetical protein [Nocardia mexicana]RDI48467.1 hypothetical protein DFR68_108300 [Nocardia mexicana]